MTYPWWDKRAPRSMRPDSSHVVTFTESMQALAVKLTLERRAKNDELGATTPAAGLDEFFITDLVGVAGEMVFAAVYRLPWPTSKGRDDGTDFLGVFDVKGSTSKGCLILDKPPLPHVRYYLAWVTLRSDLFGFGDGDWLPLHGELLGWLDGRILAEVPVQEYRPDGSGEKWKQPCRAVWWEALRGVMEGSPYVQEKRLEWMATREQDLARIRREG